MMRVIKNIYVVNLPKISDDVVTFTFSTQTPYGVFNFVLRWFDEAWHVWATLPSGEVRSAGCVPNVINWTGFTDYGLYVYSSLVNLGQFDLPGTSMVLLAWL